jgi:type II secretory pathway component HofQ
VNIVVPDYVKAAVTTRFNDVPCDAAIEVLLEAHELWYRYRPEGRLIEVLPRRQLDFADEAALQRATNRISAETLPAGPTIDLDLQDAPLQEVVQRLATRGSVNIVMPDYIKGKVTIRLTKVPWDTALRAVLAVHELGFEYRDSGHVLRIASQRELDREDEAARARGTK